METDSSAAEPREEFQPNLPQIELRNLSPPCFITCAAGATAAESSEEFQPNLPQVELRNLFTSYSITCAAAWRQAAAESREFQPNLPQVELRNLALPYSTTSAAAWRHEVAEPREEFQPLCHKLSGGTCHLHENLREEFQPNLSQVVLRNLSLPYSTTCAAAWRHGAAGPREDFPPRLPRVEEPPTSMFYHLHSCMVTDSCRIERRVPAQLATS